jgi:hypothetical protein
VAIEDGVIRCAQTGAHVSTIAATRLDLPLEIPP